MLELFSWIVKPLIATIMLPTLLICWTAVIAIPWYSILSIDSVLESFIDERQEDEEHTSWRPFRRRHCFASLAGCLSFSSLIGGIMMAVAEVDKTWPLGRRTSPSFFPAVWIVIKIHAWLLLQVVVVTGTVVVLLLSVVISGYGITRLLCGRRSVRLRTQAGDMEEGLIALGSDQSEHSNP